MNFIDYGTRWGQSEQIDLSCYATGISDPTGLIRSITNLFSGNFKTLEVFDGATQIYSWPNITVQEITFPKSYFPIGGFTPYSVKLVSYQTPSGVVDPVNEYSFSQNLDASVTVGHKISAKGIKNSIGALDNAVTFVKQFTGKNPYTNCIPAFITNGSGILMSLSEKINRAEATYSVDEVYKYTTGSVLPYIETNTLSINDSNEEDYVTIDLSINWQGSPVINNLSSLQLAASTFNPLSVLKNTYDIATGNVYQNTFNLNQSSGQASIDIKASFISGLSNDFSGYFDYSVSLEKDMLTLISSWKIEGEYICKGPLSFRRSRVASFKTANQAGSFIPYLSNLLTTSALYVNYVGFPLAPIPTQFSITENTGMATLKLSASYTDEDSFGALVHPKYSIEIEPSKWIYSLMPAANIEGHYTLQDLQMRSQAKIKLGMNSTTSGTTDANVTSINTVLGYLSGIHVSNAFLTAENVNSGISELGIEREYLGTDLVSNSLSDSKVHGSFGNGYVRPGGFKFGY